LDENHLSRLQIAAGQPPPYHIYINLLPNEWSPPKWLRDKIAKHIFSLYPTTKKSGGLTVQLDQRFGELYLDIHVSSHHLRLPLQEIENS
jgi:hypothetical protein